MSYFITMTNSTGSVVTFDLNTVLSGSTTNLDAKYIGIYGSNSGANIDQVQTDTNYYQINGVSFIDSAIVNSENIDGMSTNRTTTDSFNVAIPTWCNKVTGVLIGGGGGGGGHGSNACSSANGGKGAPGGTATSITFTRTINATDRSTGNIGINVGRAGQGSPGVHAAANSGGNTQIIFGGITYTSNGGAAGDPGNDCNGCCNYGSTGAAAAATVNSPTSVGPHTYSVSSYGNEGIGAAQTGASSNNAGNDGTAGYARMWFSF